MRCTPGSDRRSSAWRAEWTRGCQNGCREGTHRGPCADTDSHPAPGRRNRCVAVVSPSDVEGVGAVPHGGASGCGGDRGHGGWERGHRAVELAPDSGVLSGGLWTRSLHGGSVLVVLRLVAFATALPLFPLHGVFVGALSHLPGSLPAFLAVALPSLGVHGVVSISAAVPAGILPSLLLLALIGALYGSLKALVQCHLGQMVAYLAVTLLAIPWWHMAVTAGKMPQAAGYVSAVAVAMGGLLLAGHFVQARYCHLDLDKLRGLARPMPRFATLFGLLIMAAMGLPLFGVFSAFMAMMFSSSTTLPQSIVVILLVWFMASWLLVMLMQRILFGQPRPDLLYRDLSQTEVLSLVLVLCLLALGGIVPAGLFQLRDPTPPSFL